MQVGYARVSTEDQAASIEIQERELRGAGCGELFSERVSSRAKRRPQLEEALRFVRKGDVLTVTRPDRLARSVRDLLGIVDTLAERGVSLQVLSMNLDTSNASGRLMLNVMASVAEFERDLMLERQREGIAQAKAKGKFKGRKPTARAKAADVQRLRAEGKGAAEIASALKIGRSSVYRILGPNAEASN